MGPELHVRPGVIIPSWGEFIATHPPRSVGVEYMNAHPQFEPHGPYDNFDHHHGVDRMRTLSAAQQVLRAINTGFMGRFSHDEEYSPQIYVNDSDQDVSLAVYMLLHAEEIRAMRHEERKRLRELVGAEGVLDVFNGGYPYGDPREEPILGQIAHIFEPYVTARNNGELDLRDGLEAERHREAIIQVGARIALYLAGHGEERELDTRYTETGGGPGWTRFVEDGNEGRIGAFNDGIEAYLISRVRQNGNFTHTLGRMSVYVSDFDVPGLLAYLDEQEAEKMQSLGRAPDEHWGGSDTIGGSPRMHGSIITPEEAEEHINDYQRLSAEGRL